MAEIDRNPRQICFMRHKTQKMLENLVYDVGDTIGLQLDKTNNNQGYIEYYPPSEPGAEDDFFTFNSINYTIKLPANGYPVIMTNNTGTIYNVSMRIEGQNVSCSYEIYINFPWNTYLPNSEEGKQAAILALLDTFLQGNYKLVASGVLNSINPDMHNGIVLAVQNEDSTNTDIRVTYLDLDTKETAQLVILLPVASIKEVNCSLAM